MRSFTVFKPPMRGFSVGELMSAPPYMMLYVADYTADVQDLTCEQDGAYWRLLRAMWRAGGTLPNRPDKLARICGLTDERWGEIGPDVMELFQHDGGAITHKRLFAEITAAKAKADAKSRGGKASASAKANKNNDKGLNKTPTKGQVPARASEPEPDSKVILFPEAIERTLPLLNDLPAVRATRLAADWAPDGAARSYAVQHGFALAEIDRIAEDFRDYWTARPGKEASKLDWPATWRRWVRKQRERRDERKQPTNRQSWV